MNQETEYSRELVKGAILESRKLPLSLLDTNKGQIPDVPRNPRFIRDERYKKLLQSIKDDPEFLSVNEIKVFPFKGRYIVIGGNMRYRALKELGETEAVCKIIPSTATAKQLRAYIQKDNIAYGETDWEAIANEWDTSELEQWGLEIPGLDAMEEQEAQKAQEAEQRDSETDKSEPDSTIIVAEVSLFGKTSDIILQQQITKEQADKMLALIQRDGAEKVLDKILNAQ